MEQRDIKNVVAGLIFYEGKLFAAARNENDYRYGMYEFPGGKLESGETGQDALKRELLEELEMNIDVYTLFMHVSHDYPSFRLEMDVFICEVNSPGFTLLVHQKAGFFTKDEIKSLPFLGADKKIVEEIIARLDF